MTELIKITEHKGQKSISARDLHRFLESKQDFSDWIKGRINQYGFISGQDFQVFRNSMENSKRGRKSLEYSLSIDMAKELSMVERSERGKQARQYFIEMEKKAKQPKQPIEQIMTIDFDGMNKASEQYTVNSDVEFLQDQLKFTQQQLYFQTEFTNKLLDILKDSQKYKL